MTPDEARKIGQDAINKIISRNRAIPPRSPTVWEKVWVVGVSTILAGLTLVTVSVLMILVFGLIGG